jgi:SAM-dependent methyltransferase
MRQLEDQHWWFLARRDILQTLLHRLHLPAGARVLEVGCGTGGNIDMLGRFGTVTCVEQDPQAAQLAAQRNLAPVMPGELPDGMPQFPAPFDLITAFDVIEHVEEDLASLVTLSAMLKPGGRIVITVPAFNFLWSRHDDENHHKRRYRRPDLKRLAGEAHLSVDYVSYFNTWLFPVVAAVRLFRKFVPYRGPWQDMTMPHSLINQALRKLFSSERHAIGRICLPFGISLAAVLSPKA